MTTKTTKTIVFTAMIVSIMMISASALGNASAETPVGLENASAEDIAEYNKVVAIGTERFALMQEGESLKKEMQSKGYDNMSQEAKDNLNRISQEIKQLNAEMDVINENSIKRYQLNPQVKQQLEIAKNKIKESDLPSFGMSTDSLKGLLSIGFATTEKANEAELQAKIDQLIDVPFTLEFVEWDSDATCWNQDDDCDPLIGGIQVQIRQSSTQAGDCTISVPAVRNVNWWTESGFLTAAHCGNADAWQPTYTDPKVGDVTASQNSGECDCAFVKSNGNQGLDAAVWTGYGSKVSITSKSDPSVGQYVYMIGKSSGIKYGKVIANDFTFPASSGGPAIDNTIRVDYFGSIGGDSGAPFINASNLNNWHGITKGHYGSDTAFIPWTHVDTALDIQ